MSIAETPLVITKQSLNFCYPLYKLVNNWFDAERVKDNRKVFNFKPSTNPYMSYIKLVATGMDRDLLIQHFLYAAKNFRGDWFNAYVPYNHIDEFFSEFDVTSPASALPTNRYFYDTVFFRDISLDDLPESIKRGQSNEYFSFNYPHDIPLNYASKITMRNSRSPFPGYLNIGMDVEATKVETGHARSLIVRIMHTGCCESAAEIFGLACPTSDCHTVIKEWLMKYLQLSYDYIGTNGIQLTC